MTKFFQILLYCCILGACYVQAKTEAEVKQYFMRLGLQCSRDIHITPDEMIMLQKHKLPNSENARCLLACVYKKADWMDDKGMFNVAKAKAAAEKEHVGDDTMVENSKKLFDVCNKVNDEAVNDGDKGCDRAGHLFKCLTENALKLGFKI